MKTHNKSELANTALTFT